MSATMAFASTETLQNPPPSEFVDTESSVNVPIPTDEGRHIKLTLAFESKGDCPRAIPQCKHMNHVMTLV